jgi:two-component system chemotaxis response regulator CheB
MSEERLRVLVVDDSAVVRYTVTRLLSKAEGWSVSVAPDPVVALDRIRRDPPDVILLDLEMPRMDGLTFLRHLMATTPVPVVVCSSHAGPGTEAALAAMEAGAVEVFPKSKLAVKVLDEDSGVSLEDVLGRSAAAAGSLRRAWRPERRSISLTLPQEAEGAVGQASKAAKSTLRPTSTDHVVLIGASTGGPEALKRILTGLPADGPACLVVQHMLEPFTEAYARRLDAAVPMRVKLAAPGDRIQRGLVLIAPGGSHLIIHASADGPVADLVDEPPVNGHRPSVNVLFESAVSILAPHMVGVVLTGMGNDGATGLHALRQAGAVTLVQDQETSTVFGMPGAAIAHGGAMHTVPLDRMADRIMTLAVATGRVAPQERHILRVGGTE